MFVVKYTTLYSILSECMIVECVCVWSMISSICTHICVCACSPHVSECVSKVPHSFIMSSKCEEQKSRDEQKRRRKGEMKER